MSEDQHWNDSVFVCYLMVVCILCTSVVFSLAFTWDVCLYQFLILLSEIPDFKLK